MALTGTNGEYLRIESITIDADYICSVNYKIYASQAHRNSGDTDFLHSKMGNVNSGALQTKLALNANSSMSIIDNLKTQSYEAIKADTFEISTWTDC